MAVAGRALDAAIAEKVMGWTWRRVRGTRGLSYLARDTAEFFDGGPLEGDETRATDADRFVPHYSTDIAAAWTVVAEMERRGFSCVIATNACSNGHQNGAKFFEGFRGLGFDIFDGGEHKGHHAVDDTVPLAICRAALQAVEVPHV